MSMPEKEFKVGTVSATIWPRTVNSDGETFTAYSVKIQRSYRDQNGEWQETNNFRPQDLPAVETVSGEAFRYLKLRTREPDKDSSEIG